MNEKTINDMSQHLYSASAADFIKIPGQAIAYWATKSIIDIFSSNESLSLKIETREGLTTGSNNLFLRLWHEVSINNIGFNISNDSEAKSSKKKYFPYVKGGEFRRWAGNYDHIVNWYNDGEELKVFKDEKTGRIRSHNYNGSYGFRTGFTWSGISSGSFSVRHVPSGFMFDAKGPMGFSLKQDDLINIESFLNSRVAGHLLKMLAPTLDFKLGHVLNLPFIKLSNKKIKENRNLLNKLSMKDWNSSATSWGLTYFPILDSNQIQSKVSTTYIKVRKQWVRDTQEMQCLEEENNQIFIDAYGLQDELTPEVPLREITLTCNPHYRYSGDLTEQEREDRLQSDTIAELVSYAVGCMMGRYSLDREGLVYAHANNDGFADLVAEGAYSAFPADEDGIIPLTDQEWFKDDATNLFRDFIRTAWDEEHLQENLDFVAESLCLYAIKPRKNESSLEVIRRYLSTQFYKDHLKTYKKRPIYWLFSSGKQKAFECLVYLHRYNDGTLARMRTEYVSPLLGKYDAYAEQLDKQIDNASSTAEANRLKKELATLQKKQVELREFDDKLKHFADMRISIDLDDGVKVNYGKFGDLLANVKDITGEAPVL